MKLKPHWTEEVPLEYSLKIMRDLALRHCRLAGRVGEEIALLIMDGDYQALCDFDFPYNIDLPVSHVIHGRQALAFYQKFENLDLGIDKEVVAYRKFKDSESDCLATNDVFRRHLHGEFNFHPADSIVLYKARRKISAILGRCPKLWELRHRFGPGATTEVKRSEACVQTKLAAPLACSLELLHSGILPSILRSVPHWTAQHVSHRYIDEDGWLCDSVAVTPSYGRLEFVPKSAKTYRSIVVEPGLNTFVQQGILRHMMGRLSQAGIDLHDQSLNQKLARRGSLTGELATLDLSSASDCVSTGLVKFLLPPDWFTLLSSCRTGTVMYKNEVINLEKFSSMGNAFTFPLESLIFFALTWAACPDGNIGVYGDDIICPTSGVRDVVRVLSVCGFTVNQQKSFDSGPFRESCGSDYYFGIDVRPYYQKHLVSCRSLFNLHNFYRRNYDEEGVQAVLRFIPEELRIYGPDGYGDGHLLGDWLPKTRRKLSKKGYRGYFFETYALKGARQPSKYPGDYISPLYSIYDRGEALADPALPGHYVAPVKMERDPIGRPLYVVPGSKGYKKLSIYTLSI